MMRVFDLKRDSNVRLTEHFTVKEFACHDGSNRILIHSDLPKLLEEIRQAFGEAVYINSAYRTLEYNRKIGGAAMSQHVQGTAADIRVNGVPPYAVAAWMEKRIKSKKRGACGYYPMSLFCHVDVRPNPTLFLEYKKGKTKAVSGFGLGEKYRQFLVDEREELEEMTQKDFNRMADVWLASLTKREPAKWSEDSRKWAEENGLVSGRFCCLTTREELAEALRKFFLKLDKDEIKG